MKIALYLPNFRDKVRRWRLEPELDSIRQSHGKYYLLPGLHEKVRSGYSLSFRTDVLDKLGLTLPTSWDEVYDVLRALKAEYPGTYPWSDRWSTNTPFPCGALFGYLGQAYGVKSGWSVNDSNIGRAAASYWLKGSRPRISSMVRSIPEVEYML